MLQKRRKRLPTKGRSALFRSRSGICCLGWGSMLGKFFPDGQMCDKHQCACRYANCSTCTVPVVSSLSAL